MLSYFFSDIMCDLISTIVFIQIFPLFYDIRAQRWRSLAGVQDAEERPTDEFGRLKLSAQEDKHRRNGDAVDAQPHVRSTCQV